MATVHVLPPALASQIAAGEVVERPASAAKELIENALDAEATRCDVSCSGGGVTSLAVSDDGFGMSEEDALRAIERHATSKLTKITDLHQLRTFGFRGEALPSIASVSHFSIRTRPKNSDHGCCVEVDCGKPPVIRREGMPVGTTVTVRDLFVNVPARRKFLRSTGTESAHVTAALEGAALSRHDVTFTLERDGRRVRELLRVATRRDRVLQLLPEEALADVRGERGPLRFEAHLSRPERARPGTSGLWLLVNGRAVRDRMLAATIAQAYGSALPSGSYPRGVVYLDLPSELVDVNVHPQKAEVRFVDPRALADAVYSIVSRAVTTEFSLPAGNRGARYAQPNRNAPPVELLPVERGALPLRKREPTADELLPLLRSSGAAAQQRSAIEKSEVIPTVARVDEGVPTPAVAGTDPRECSLGVAEGNHDVTAPIPAETRQRETPPQQHVRPDPSKAKGPLRSHEEKAADADEPAPATMVTPPSDPFFGVATDRSETAVPPPPPLEGPQDKAERMRFVAQARRGFLVVEGPDGLQVIDQHAAAERVTHSKLLAEFRSGSVAAQSLLFPTMLELAPKQVALLEARLAEFKALGLDVRVRGYDRISIHSAPRLLQRASPERLVADLLDALDSRGQREPTAAIEHAIAHMACHGALQANESLTAPHAQSLLDSFAEVSHPPPCVHGRPIVAALRYIDMERLAGRR